MEKIAIFGAGGFGREIACLINTINKESKQWDFIGFFDDGLEIGFKNKYGEVLGGLNDLNSYPEKTKFGYCNCKSCCAKENRRIYFKSSY
jgi:hypothetical protein